jgi:hypothetical protein
MWPFRLKGKMTSSERDLPRRLKRKSKAPDDVGIFVRLKKLKNAAKGEPRF